jgi:hypothetical protein
MEMARFEAGHKKLPGAGRKAGTPNKVTATARQVIEQVAVNLGGVEGFTAWALASKINQRAFWTQIFPRLLPVQVHGSGTLEISSKTLTPAELTEALVAHGLPPTLFGAETPGLADVPEQINEADHETKH